MYPFTNQFQSVQIGASGTKTRKGRRLIVSEKEKDKNCDIDNIQIPGFKVNIVTDESL